MFKTFEIIIWSILIAALLVFWKPIVYGKKESKLHIVVNKYNDPIFTWNEEERYLTITPHMRRDAFICMRDQCKLVEEWISK